MRSQIGPATPVADYSAARAHDYASHSTALSFPLQVPITPLYIPHSLIREGVAYVTEFGRFPSFLLFCKVIFFLEKPTKAKDRKNRS